MTAKGPIDFVGLAAALLDRARTLVPQWLPAGVERQNRWYVGDFDGGPGESANVHLETGTWIDNASADDRGGDLISLYARIHNLGMGEAARDLMEQLGWEKSQRSTAASQARAGAHGEVQAPALGAETPGSAGASAEPDVGAAASVPGRPAKAARWKLMAPVPSKVGKPSFRWGFKDKKAGDWVNLEAVRTWRYEFEGDLFGHVARYERVDSHGELKKETIPWTWNQDLTDPAGACRWVARTWDEPRPLYVPRGRLSDPPKPVVVVEGEKCADAGHQLLGEEFDFVSWPGGCKTWAFASWHWLVLREAILWPDCDAQRERLTAAERLADVDRSTKPVLPQEKQPGWAAMMHVGTELQAKHRAPKVTVCRISAPGARADGWDIADAIAEGWDADRVRAFLLDAAPFQSPNLEARAKAKSIAAADDAVADVVGWRALLTETSKGTIQPTRENIILAIDGRVMDTGRRVPGIADLQGVIAYNEFSNDVVKLKPAPWGSPAGVWTEADELWLGEYLVGQHYMPSVSRQTLDEAVKSIAHKHAWHPVRERFVALRDKWDGEKRLATWLTRCCRKEGLDVDQSAPLQQYLARVGTWTLMGIVARVMKPGVKFDYMPILEGEQGMGKSTLARVLGLDWFADTGLVIGDKDSLQNIQGVLVYEWGELDSLSKADIRKVKGFVTSDHDRFRASFDRRPKDYPRQCVFIGTTNEAHYLTDPTGNRRFWPVKITRRIDLAWVRANLEQIYAEALSYFEAGQRFHVSPREQTELFGPQQGERTIEDGMEAAIRRYLYDEHQKMPVGTENGSLVNEIAIADLLNVLGISVDKQTTVVMRSASTALTRLGWERAKSKGRRGEHRPYVYRRPADADTEALQRASGGSDQSPNAGHQQEGADDDCPF